MPVSDSPKILETLVSAGLVSHELIGDPARLAAESAALAALCARIAGPVYRLGAFHYAFRIAEGDLGGTLVELEPQAWGEALQVALAAELGEEAVWITPAAELVAEAEAALDARPILFLKAGDGAVTAALAEAPEIRAVIHAGIAARTAEAAAMLAAEAVAEATREAGGGAGAVAAALADLSGRVAALEATLEGVVAGAVETGFATGLAPALRTAVADALAGKVEAAVGTAMRQISAARAADPAAERLGGIVEGLAARLAEREALAREEAARQDALASGIAALEASVEALTAEMRAERMEGASVDTMAELLAGRDAALAAFESRIGLTLAEFLARLAPAEPAPASPSRIVEMAAPVADRPAAAGTGRLAAQAG